MAARTDLITAYAYTYESACVKLLGYILLKVGDTIRAASTRMGEQGTSAEWEEKIPIGIWKDLKVIKRDSDIVFSYPLAASIAALIRLAAP